MSEKSLFGKLLGLVRKEPALKEQLAEPNREVIKTSVGTTYIGEVFGMTDRKTRPSNDRSAAMSIDQNQGVAVVVCDGAGSGPDASLIAGRMTTEFKNVADFTSHGQTPDDRLRVLLEAPIQAIENFNAAEGKDIPWDDNASTTLIGYVIFDRILTQINAGDSELHVIGSEAAECVSSRTHHSHKEDENQLLVAVSRQDRYFKGESSNKELRSGDVVMSFSDGFTEYFFKQAIFDFTDAADVPEDFDEFKVDQEFRRGALYQKRMLELKALVLRYIEEGKNPVEELLKIAQTNAERFARNPGNRRGYHDDISLAITIID